VAVISGLERALYGH